MTSPFIKVTQVKLDIRKIIDNLKHLENHEKNELALDELQNETDNLLSYLESLPLENLQTKLRKRLRRRNIKRSKKVKKRAKQTSLSSYTNEESTSSITLLETPNDSKTKLKPHHQLKSLQECQRFLKTFELLEQLHLARGQVPSRSRKFSAKLQQLKSVWNCLLKEQQQEKTSIQQLWHEVLFGPPEKTYFQAKPDLQQFIVTRQTWDSYIDHTHGSSIPTGWIVPPLKTNRNWHNCLASPLTDV